MKRNLIIQVYEWFPKTNRLIKEHKKNMLFVLQTFQIFKTASTHPFLETVGV